MDTNKLLQEIERLEAENERLLELSEEYRKVAQAAGVLLRQWGKRDFAPDLYFVAISDLEQKHDDLVAYLSGERGG